MVPGEAVRSDNLRREGELKKYFEQHFRWIAETYCPKLLAFNSMDFNLLIMIIQGGHFTRRARISPWDHKNQSMGNGSQC